MIRRLLGLLPAVLCAGCLSAERPEPPTAPIAWDFPAEVPGAVVSLWPAPAHHPRRVRYRIKSREEGDLLKAEVDGRDPYFTWQLDSPLHAAALRVELESVGGGTLQAFWTCAQCPVFGEQCSARQDVGAGHRTVTFLIAARDPIRDFRLDLPEGPGQTFSLRSVTALAEPALDVPWEPRASGTTVESAPYGLLVHALLDDPWMLVPTPGLHASRATAVEVTLHGPSGPPQLYWTGPCPQFTEDCSVRLVPVDAGALTHRADLRRSPLWKGDISALRLDPGPGRGEYWIDRIALVHD